MSSKYSSRPDDRPEDKRVRRKKVVVEDVEESAIVQANENNASAEQMDTAA